MQYYPQQQGPMQHYQQAGTWGTNQFQFGAPPPLGFQPQSTWGGRDFYRAHAMDADPSLYDHAWNSVRDYRGYESSATLGVGIHEARHWHRQAYGGLGQVQMMQPPEIGHAAAYEAYRTWIHNRSVYEPLGPDIERQREALIGLAIGEATRLFQYTNRPQDSYGRQEACECAAATASHIFYWSRERDEGEHFRGRSQYGGFEDVDDEPYAYDTHAMYPDHHHRAHSRHRSSSRHYPPPIGYAGSGAGPPIGYAGSGGEPPPIGYAGSGSGLPPVGFAGSAPGMGMSYPAGGMGYAGSGPGMPSYAGSGAGMLPGATYPGGAPYPGSASMSYPQQQYGMQMPMSQGQYGVSPTYGSPTIVSPGQPGAFSMPYMQQSYGVGQGVAQYMPGQQPYIGQPMVSPPTVIIKSRKKHRHRSSSRHRSADVYNY